MLQIFWSIIDYLRRLEARLNAIEEYVEEQERWRDDPLSHPVIATMSERERADLPFSARARP